MSKNCNQERKQDNVCGPLGPEEINEYIPHRRPFAFLDRVTALVPGEWAEGYKLVSRNEWYFDGHFPQGPLLPGVVMVEALAQLAAVCFSPRWDEDSDDAIGVFTGMDDVRFRRPVRPGDRLDLNIQLKRSRGNFVQVEAEAAVEGEMAVSGVLSFALVDWEEYSS